MSVERLCGEELMLTDDLLLETDLLGQKIQKIKKNSRKTGGHHHQLHVKNV